jgi:hypothetical protein
MKAKTVKGTGDRLEQQSPRKLQQNRSNRFDNSTADRKKVPVPTVSLGDIQLLSPKYRQIAERLIQKNALVLVDGDLP